MKIVIDIPEEDYILAIKDDYRTIYGSPDAHIAEAIKAGVRLPNNHGRLIDEKVIIGMADKDLNWVYDLTDLSEYIAGLPAVIPAESEEENDKRRSN